MGVFVCMCAKEAAETGDVETISRYLDGHPQELNSFIDNNDEWKFDDWIHLKLTFLGFASMRGHKEVVKFLVEKDGIEVNKGLEGDFYDGSDEEYVLLPGDDEDDLLRGHCSPLQL